VVVTIELTAPSRLSQDPRIARAELPALRRWLHAGTNPARIHLGTRRDRGTMGGGNRNRDGNRNSDAARFDRLPWPSRQWRSGPAKALLGTESRPWAWTNAESDRPESRYEPSPRVRQGRFRRVILTCFGPTTPPHSWVKATVVRCRARSRSPHAIRQISLTRRTPIGIIGGWPDGRCRPDRPRRRNRPADGADRADLRHLRAEPARKHPKTRSDTRTGPIGHPDRLIGHPDRPRNPS
jgi:hypothetical protein